MPAESNGLRVAQLIECDGPGGAEHVVAELSRALQAGGAEVVTLLPLHGEGWLEQQLAGSGVMIERFEIDRPVAPAFVRSLARMFRQHKISIAHSHEFTMAVYGAWAARLARIPHVITMHGGRYYAGRLRRRLAMRTATALSGRTVGVSNSMSAALRRDHVVSSSRIVTIPNGVRRAAPQTPTLRQELNLEPGASLVVAVGNLYPVKGHRYLLDALRILAEQHRRVHVAIAGRGDLEESLRASARESGLAHRVHLLGLRSDVPAVIAAADVFVLPSLSEGLPLALLEAMFAGRPIVASRVGDVSVALDDGRAGVLVPPGDGRALANAIEALLRNPARASALGEAAARRVATEYDVSCMVARYVDIYRQLLPALEPLAFSAWSPGSTGAPLAGGLS